MSDTVSIVLADDHTLVREALGALLRTEPRFSIVGEAANGLEVPPLVDKLQPDVLVTDLMMPGMGGIEVARQVRRQHPNTRVLILSMHMNEAHVMEALRSGAHGYMRKDATARDLVHAIREVSEGHLYLSAPFSDRAIEAYRQRSDAAARDPYDTLTPREREVLHLAAEGHGHQEVARRLHISPRTAETHRANMMRKLGLRKLSDVVRFALRRGLIGWDGDTPAGPAADTGE